MTGGARGLGRAFALELAHSGYDVAVIDRDLEAYREFPEEPFTRSVIDDLADLGVRAIGFEADVTNRAELTEVARRIASEWGQLDGLICNAGGGSGELDGNRAASVHTSDLQEMLDRNLFGTVNTVQAHLSLLEAGDSASIVTMSSQNGLDATDTGRYAHYGVAKAAVAHYSRYLARDLGPRGIRVNCVAPGPIATGRLLRRMAESPQVNRTDANALQRLGTPSDVAPVVRFLVSPDAGFITGQVIRIDGGI